MFLGWCACLAAGALPLAGQSAGPENAKSASVSQFLEVACGPEACNLSLACPILSTDPATRARTTLVLFVDASTDRDVLVADPVEGRTYAALAPGEEPGVFWQTGHSDAPVSIRTLPAPEQAYARAAFSRDLFIAIQCVRRLEEEKRQERARERLKAQRERSI
jgi:hypothetical protein